MERPWVSVLLVAFTLFFAFFMFPTALTLESSDSYDWTQSRDGEDDDDEDDDDEDDDDEDDDDEDDDDEDDDDEDDDDEDDDNSDNQGGNQNDNSVNSAPFVSNVEITITTSNMPVTEAYYNLNLICEYDFYDPDGDTELESIIHWLKDDIVVSEYDNLTILPSSITSIGDVWTVSVIPSDGRDIGALERSSNSVVIIDYDSDNDGYGDSSDAFPYNSTEWNDADGDGVGDNSDQFPNDASEFRDSDGDGIGDNADQDDDNDGIVDDDDDSDGDGIPDSSDLFPNNQNEWSDLDMDGVGDNADVFPNDGNETDDSDGDGVGDNTDQFPNDASEFRDSDSDGVGDNSDQFPNDPSESVDSDGDGVGDNSDEYPEDSSKYETEISEQEIDFEGDILVENIPDSVSNVVFREVPGGMITEAEVEREDGMTVYEITIVKDDTEYELEISSEGILIEIESDKEEDDEEIQENFSPDSNYLESIYALFLMAIVGLFLHKITIGFEEEE